MRQQPITVSAGWWEERPAAPSGQWTVRDPHGPPNCSGTRSSSLAKNSTPQLQIKKGNAFAEGRRGLMLLEHLPPLSGKHTCSPKSWKRSVLSMPCFWRGGDSFSTCVNW